MANERLRPFRDQSEHDVINLFAFGDDAAALGTTDVIQAGSVVKVKTGWTNGAETEFPLIAFVLLQKFRKKGKHNICQFEMKISGHHHIPKRIQFTLEGS